MHPFAFVGCYDGDGCPFQPFSAAAACTVQIMGRFFGHIQVDDMGHPFDIQPAGADIGSHQHIDAAFAETVHGVLSVHFAGLTINPVSLDAMVAQFFHRHFDIFGVIQEHHCLGRLFPCNDFSQIQKFFSVGRKNVVMFNAFGHNAAAFRFQIDAILFHHADCFFFRFPADGSRKQHDLSVPQGCLDDCLHIFHIAVIHQSVSFIQNDGLYQMGLNFFLSDEVKDTSHRANHNTGFGFQFFYLSANARRTDEQSTAHFHAAVFLQQFRLMKDLYRQFVGGCQDDGLGAFHIHIDFFKNRQKIRQCLAGTCFGTADDIFSFQHRRNHLFLYFCGGFDLLLCQCAHQCRSQSQISIFIFHIYSSLYTNPRRYLKNFVLSVILLRKPLCMLSAHCL